MKHINLKKAVEKYVTVNCVKLHSRNPQYHAEFEGMVISWFTSYYSPDEASCVNVRHKDDNHDLMSDYHAGSFYYTIKSAIGALTYNLRQKQGAA